MNERDDFFSSSMNGPGQDAKFDSKSIVDKESGKVFGGLFSVPVGLATAIEAAWNRFEPEARKVIKTNLHGAVQFAAQRYGHMDPVEAKALGFKVADAFGYASVFWQDIAYSGSATLKANKALIDLRSTVAPVLKANNQSLGVGILLAPGCDNEVISNARGKIINHYMHQLGKSVWDLPARLPNLYITHQESKLHAGERALELEADKLKNASSDEKRALIRKQMEEFREARKGTGGDLDKMLTEERKRFEKEMGRQGFREQGRNSGSFHNQRTGEYRYWSNEKKAFEDKYKEIFAKHETSTTELEKTAAQKARADIEEKVKLAKEYGTWGGALVAQAAAYQMDKDAEEKFSKPLALDMITHLKDEVETNAELKKQWLEDPEHVMITGEPNGRNAGKQLTIKQYIGEIFQQHQIDCKQAKIGERFFEKDSDMDRITSMIAEAVMREKIDTMALVDLVGQRKVVKRGGKHFVRDNQLKQLIDHEAKILPANQKVDIEEVKANSTFDIEELKKIFDKDTGVKGEERVFMALSFPKNVLVQHAGLKPEEVDALHAEAAGRFHNMMGNAVCELAQMAEQNPEILKNLKITQKEIDRLCQTAQAIQSGEEHALDKSMGIGGEAGIEETVRNVAVQMERQDKSFIKRLINNGKAHAAAQHKEEQADAANENNRREVDSERLNDLIGNQNSSEFMQKDGRAVVPSSLADKLNKETRQKSADPSLGLSV